MNAKESRREISDAQVDIARTILTQLFPYGADGIGTHHEELAEAEIAAQVASNLFRRAAEVHRGLLVSWKQMCDAAFLSAAANQLKESQDVLEPLLRQLGVELVRQDNWRKGAALPGFRVVDGAARFDKDDKAEPPAPESEPSEPSCCSGCVNSPAQCVHSPKEDGECVGRETEPSVSASEPEDLTALDGEPKGDEQPEICS